MLIFMGFIRFCCYIALENGQLVDCLLILVGGLEHILFGNFIIPTDELIFFKGVAKNHQHHPIKTGEIP